MPASPQTVDLQFPGVQAMLKKCHRFSSDIKLQYLGQLFWINSDGEYMGEALHTDGRPDGETFHIEEWSEIECQRVTRALITLHLTQPHGPCTYVLNDDNSIRGKSYPMRGWPTWEDLKAYPFNHHPNNLVVTTNADAKTFRKAEQKFLRENEGTCIEHLLRAEGWFAVTGCATKLPPTPQEVRAQMVENIRLAKLIDTQQTDDHYTTGEHKMTEMAEALGWEWEQSPMGEQTLEEFCLKATPEECAEATLQAFDEWRYKNGHLTADEIKELAHQALSAACKLIQDKLHIRDGGYASMFFSDDEVENKLAEYIRDEVKHNQE